MTFAFLFIECVKDQAENVKKIVKEIKGVSEAHSTGSGRYDVVAKVQADDETKLKHVIDTVKGVAGIIAVVTAIVYAHAS